MKLACWLFGHPLSAAGTFCVRCRRFRPFLRGFMRKTPVVRAAELKKLSQGNSQAQQRLLVLMRLIDRGELRVVA